MRHCEERDEPISAATHAQEKRDCFASLAMTLCYASHAVSFPREIKISHPIVRGRAEPHAALRVEEEVAHRILRMRNRIFDHLAAVRIERSEERRVGKECIS